MQITANERNNINLYDGTVVGLRASQPNLQGILSQSLQRQLTKTCCVAYVFINRA